MARGALSASIMYNSLIIAINKILPSITPIVKEKLNLSQFMDYVNQTKSETGLVQYVDFFSLGQTPMPLITVIIGMYGIPKDAEEIVEFKNDSNQYVAIVLAVDIDNPIDKVASTYIAYYFRYNMQNNTWEVTSATKSEQ